jgi:hypothetical protein
MQLLLHAEVVLAIVVAQPDPDAVKPGWIAAVVLGAIGVATYLLWRSMNRQLRKVDFDDGSTPADRADDQLGDRDGPEPRA